jgi:hypothetical protein
MDLDGYDFSFDKKTKEYIFFSKGVKGVIAKSVKFQKIGKDLFNLSFGDVDPETRIVNEKVISNNGDRQKVLVTVAKVVLDYLEFNPHAAVIATGNTASRTRLYQMNICFCYRDVNHLFEIKGFKNNR